MEIPVLIEPVASNGYIARTGEPLALSAEGATRLEAINKLRELLNQRVANGAQISTPSLPGPSDPNPWIEFAGMFKDDPYFDEWQQAIAENRRKADLDPDIPRPAMLSTPTCSHSGSTVTRK